ncbi:MAG: BamA/TamA family outer membrane protein, partial [Fidelibacterota bacterium]
MSRVWLIVTVQFLLQAVSSAFSEPDSSVVVKGIRIDGNRVTKDYVIRREIQHPVGVPFDSALAAEDRDRIDNLGIFGDVSYFLSANPDSVHVLVYSVVETWRILPLPIIIFEEETGLSLGGIVFIKNFRGRNELLNVFAAGGGRKFGGHQFQDPWITGDHVSLQAHLIKSVFRHPYLGFDYNEWDGEVTLGRYFGYQWKVWLTASVEERRVVYSKDGERNLRHRYFQSKFQLMYDTRDLYIDPAKGMLIFTEFRPDVGLDDLSPNNAFLENQISVFRTVVPGKRKWVAGGSIFFHKYFGESIPYKIVMVGGRKSVRGWTALDSVSYRDKPQRAGLNVYYVSAELRQSLIPKHLTALGTEFGLILAEYVDLGAADDRFSAMLRKRPIGGAGIGIRTFIPGAMLFR